MNQSGTQLLRQMLAQSPQLHAARADLAQALCDEGDYEGAIAEAGAALRGNPRLDHALLARAAARRALCHHELAIDDYERALRLAPHRAAILINLAGCYAALDLWGEAEHRLRRAVALLPDSAEAWASYAATLLRHDKQDEAEAACRRALAIDAGNLTAHRTLAGLLRDPAGAKAHRDAAYQRRQIFIEAAAHPRRHVLVLAAANAANVPLRHLLPRTENTLIYWYGEYALPGQDRALPRFDVIFNAVGDADLAPELSPPVLDLLQNQTDLVVNSPEKVAAAARRRLPALLAGMEGIVVPEARAAGDAGTMPLPWLARPAGSHGGAGLRLIENKNELYYEDIVTRFYDYRSSDGCYRKYRFIFVDGAVLPYHLAIAPHWMVHYWTAGMAESPAKRAEEQRFLRDPVAVVGAAHWAALAAIARRIGLDYAGIDCGLLPDGRLIVFEANATMLVHPEPEPLFAYRNPAVARIGAAFGAMLDRIAGRGRRAGG